MNKNKNLSLYILPLIFFGLMSCDTSDTLEFPREPEISIISTTGQSFHFTVDTSGILFKIRLRDGDKDMGLSAKDSVFVFEDYRSDTLYQTVYLGLPEIPRETIPNSTLWADVEIPMRSIYFVPRPDTVHILSMTDTLIFKIHCVDDAGNKSNIVISDTIYVFP